MSAPRSKDPHQEDLAVQGAVLHHVLDEHPAMLRLSDLIREVPSGSDLPGDRDAIERAVRELVRHGLLDHLDAFVLPTRAAVYSRILGER
ncbi:MAG: hypothetical protein ACTHK6_00425 [Solirubrobacterales bacterium]